MRQLALDFKIFQFIEVIDRIFPQVEMARCHRNFRLLAAGENQLAWVKRDIERGDNDEILFIGQEQERVGEQGLQFARELLSQQVALFLAPTLAVLGYVS